MRGPKPDGGDGEKEMLTGMKGPRTCEREGHPNGVAWERFDGSLCAAVADVAVDEDGKAEEALKTPADHDDLEVC